MAKICRRCGTPSKSDTAVKCAACGTPFPAQSIPTAPVNPNGNANQGGMSETAVTDLIERITDATVFVVSMSLESGSTGTGFFINYENETYLISNLHVVENAVQGGIVTIRFSDKINPRQDNFTASIVWFDPVNDLAILDVNFPIPQNVKPLELVDMASLRNGQNVVSVGCPKHMRFNSVRGSIAQVNYTDESIQMSRVLCTLSATNGNSGGSVVRESDGKVIGVATAIFLPEFMQSHTLCVTADAIRQLIFMYNKARRS